MASLTWLLEKDGVVPIPRTSSLEHAEVSLAARDVELNDEDVEMIESVDCEEQLEDPDWME